MVSSVGRNTQRSSPWDGGIRRKPLKLIVVIPPVYIQRERENTEKRQQGIEREGEREIGQSEKQRVRIRREIILRIGVIDLKLG